MTSRIIHGDCLTVLPTLPKDAVVVSDPPHGIGLDCLKDRKRGRQKFALVEGDDRTFDPSPWMAFRDVILWGCNHYPHAIPPHEGQWYFWDKVTKNGLNLRIAEGEFCWHKKGTRPMAFRHLWSGAYRASEAGKKSVHPTQKPVALMRWCIERMKLPPNSLIVDPYCGSGSTGVAAVEMGHRFIGIESDPAYHAVAESRIAAAAPAPDLFASTP